MRHGISVFLVALMFMFVAANTAFAQSGTHGDGHSEHHEWYKTLKRPDVKPDMSNGMGSCCNDKDCRPTRGYLHDDGKWRAILNGKWVEVPWDKVLNTKAPDGNSHICANELGIIFCFVGGVPKS